MLQIKEICKEYKTGNLVQKALDNVSLNLRDNEFVAILGPSGSGKTTLLNIIGGLDRYDKGDLIINGVSTKKYKDRDWDTYRSHTIGFVFQSYNLIPHQTILSNVELALTISGVSKKERKKRAMKALKDVGLEKHEHKRPNQLSGGQMQRVAIARALVNNPKIILADEPTGALDSETSIQVMNLLKEVAKDRLVVMVTHNPELAEKYATRIVKLKDGVILSDSDPYEIKKKKKKDTKKDYKTKKISKDKKKKSSMPLLTSMSLSFNNLRTKKTRTFLISFAGSIGIIGIALILSLSNGINNYIKSVERETLSEYPIQIQSTGMDISSMLQDTSNMAKEKNDDGDKVKVSKELTNMFSKMGSNDLAALKKYFESEDSNINDYAKAIEYKYDVTPVIFSSNTDELVQVNPDTTFSSMGIDTSVATKFSSYMTTNVFYQIPNDSSLFADQYDVKAGKWPTNYNECVLVLNPNGSISDMMLYVLGIKNHDELVDMVNKFIAGETVETPEIADEYTYDQILNVSFKLINGADEYEYDNNYKTWRDKSDNTDYMKNLVKNGEDINIVGIVEPKPDSKVYALQPGIGYISSLTNHVIEKAANSDIVKAQIASPDVNIFTGKRFDENEDVKDSFDMNSLVDVDSNAIKSAFKVDQSKLKVDFGNVNKAISKTNMPELKLENIINKIDFSLSESDMKTLVNDVFTGFEAYIKKNHPEADSETIAKKLREYLNSKVAQNIIQKGIEEAIKENKSISITEEQMQKIMNDVIENYKIYADKNNIPTSEKLQEYLTEYLESDDIKSVITKNLTKIIQSQNLDKQISKIVEDYLKSSMTQVSKSLEGEINRSIRNLSKSMASAVSIDTNKFASAFKLKVSENDMLELFSGLLNKDQNSYDNNLKKLNYADFDKPYSIDIYPKDFEANSQISNILSEYNSKMKEQGKSDKVISYTDMVGTLMNSVTTIVNVVSYALIAFVSISLVVSSIMIGVITYISVLERKKEIGILRAMGASKRNISQIFNSETFIIGLLAGLMGVLITLILQLPLNALIYKVSDGVNVKCSLPFSEALILILLSIVLTLIGGLIPSRKAAKEDPVLALRTE